MRRVASGVVLGALLAVPVVAFAAPATTPPRPSVVVLRDIAFRPGTLRVPAGTWVTFAWRDGDTPHDVTPVGRRRFRRLAPRQTGLERVHFGRRGTFRFVCTIHPGMAGRVIVG